MIFHWSDGLTLNNTGKKGFLISILLGNILKHDRNMRQLVVFSEMLRVLAINSKNTGQLNICHVFISSTVTVSLHQPLYYGLHPTQTTQTKIPAKSSQNKDIWSVSHSTDAQGCKQPQASSSQHDQIDIEHWSGNSDLCYSMIHAMELIIISKDQCRIKYHYIIIYQENSCCKLG